MNDWKLPPENTGKHNPTTNQQNRKNLTEAEEEMALKMFEEKLKKYYSGHLPPSIRKELLNK